MIVKPNVTKISISSKQNQIPTINEMEMIIWLLNS